jgi:predicted dehydrogenase
MLRVGMIGAGYWSRCHAAGYRLNSEVELAAICDPDTERARAFAAEFDLDTIFDDAEALAADDAIDLIDVLTPPGARKDIVLAALANGKHLICEKPFSLNAADALEMYEAARTAGVVHAMGLQRRYDPAYRALRRMILDGYVGETRYVAVSVVGNWSTAYVGNPHRHWHRKHSLGGGFAAQALGHFLDLVRYIFGEFEPIAATSSRNREVQSDQADTRDPDLVEDTAIVTGTIPTGGIAVVTGTWTGQYPSGFRWEIYGTDGSIRLEADMTLSGARAGAPALAPIAIPPDFLPEVGRAQFLAADPRDGFGRQGIEQNSALFGSIAHDVAATIDGRGDGNEIYATFQDAWRLQQIVDAVRAGS